MLPQGCHICRFHMPDNKITKPRTIEDIRKSIQSAGTGFNSENILKLADKELEGFNGPKEMGPETNAYKAMTLFEFDQGLLMLSAIPDRFRVFALEHLKNLKKEYDCKTSSEKSLAEIAALNFIRVLVSQFKINDYLDKCSVTDIGVGYLNVMSRELDRAERHYLTSLQALRMLKLPLLRLNIRTNTAVVGQNQVVQVKNP